MYRGIIFIVGFAMGLGNATAASRGAAVFSSCDCRPTVTTRGGETIPIQVLARGADLDPDAFGAKSVMLEFSSEVQCQTWKARRCASYCSGNRAVGRNRADLGLISLDADDPGTKVRVDGIAGACISPDDEKGRQGERSFLYGYNLQYDLDERDLKSVRIDVERYVSPNLFGAVATAMGATALLLLTKNPEVAVTRSFAFVPSGLLPQATRNYELWNAPPTPAGAKEYEFFRKEIANTKDASALLETYLEEASSTKQIKRLIAAADLLGQLERCDGKGPCVQSKRAAKLLTCLFGERENRCDALSEKIPGIENLSWQEVSARLVEQGLTFPELRSPNLHPGML